MIAEVAKSDDPTILSAAILHDVLEDTETTREELANAFGELTDAAEQRRRFAAEKAKKQALYGETYPVDEDFLAALEHGLPECAGIALGFDRLVMLATGAEHIDDVLWAPVA